MKVLSPLKWVRSRTQKPDPFVNALMEQTQHLMDGAQAVLVYMDAPSKSQVLQVRLIEEKADAARRSLILQLNKAFITPIDREDLFRLSRSIDDVLDYLYSLTREMYLLKVPPNHHLKAMAVVLNECAVELHEAIKKMEHEAAAAIQHTVRVRRLENRMDMLYITALTDLFQQVATPDDMINILKLREIYRHMIHAVNSAEQAGNLINDVLVKFH